MPNFDHWLVTRFNIPMQAHRGRSTDADWLAHRLTLFSKYCVPSVASQSCRNFRWLLLVDRETPPSWMDALQSRQREHPFEVLQVTTSWKKELAVFLSEHFCADYLLTTRLDNDDGIHRDFVQALQEAFDGQILQFVDTPLGLKLDEVHGELFSFVHPSGPFMTLIEQVSGPLKTVYCSQHTRVSEIGPLCRVMLNPAWLQIIHDRNLCNRVEPTLKRLPLSRLAADFPHLANPC